MSGNGHPLKQGNRPKNSFRFGSAPRHELIEGSTNSTTQGQIAKAFSTTPGGTRDPFFQLLSWLWVVDFKRLVRPIFEKWEIDKYMEKKHILKITIFEVQGNSDIPIQDDIWCDWR